MTTGKSGLALSEQNLVPIPLEAEISGSLSYIYSWEKPPLEVLGESWQSS